MEDEAGLDEKILAVPIDKITQIHRNVQQLPRTFPRSTCARITHFFEHYKDLEPDKWVKVLGWADADEARQIIMEGIERLAAKAKG